MRWEVSFRKKKISFWYGILDDDYRVFLSAGLYRQEHCLVFPEGDWRSSLSNPRPQ